MSDPNTVTVSNLHAPRNRRGYRQIEGGGTKAFFQLAASVAYLLRIEALASVLLYGVDILALPIVGLDGFGLYQISR